jgi:hypothetical protein
MTGDISGAGRNTGGGGGGGGALFSLGGGGGGGGIFMGGGGIFIGISFGFGGGIGGGIIIGGGGGGGIIIGSAGGGGIGDIIAPVAGGPPAGVVSIMPPVGIAIPLDALRMYISSLSRGAAVTGHRCAFALFRALRCAPCE